MEKFEELKTWADKWHINYEISENKDCICISFDSITYYPAEFHYYPKTGDYDWYGGD